ncbi:adenosylcobinamide-GDP ribazoletransferase [Vibrio metoecus]|uniref:adenosylcobinamide-GDP ribazoletransferase n=1 Tax=Vibrio metoecus TaxID=1481663 RepID=UPI0006D8458E|nr:adenosylcobinamide-GDP ribazoletransferase [Vibrio metoecus]KQB05137.1 cobalamin synthase [Vibrio metoecus]PAR56195.1 adenosylcobinamide-GDP ribazoletransferase [Vibrio metoecus]PAR64562.1 adenosylcobinamide-GDP ribazoletransferase [Vibrio metoecus]
MAAILRYQLELFLLALSFFSRIPVPVKLPYSSERMNQAGRYFALVGLVLGAICALVYSLATQLFSTNISVFLTIVLSLLLTGAFHEDGLADMADGIGGGMTAERRLEIMKDSRIGTYGASALMMTLLGKYLLLTELADLTSLVPVWLLAYTLSRAVAASLIHNTPYVSDPDSSKSKPLAQQQSGTDLAILGLTALTTLVCFSWQLIGVMIAVSLIFRQVFRQWLMKRLGGFSGDCLGGAQQLMELMTYLILLAFLQHELMI